MPKVVVIGGSGFLGSHVCDSLTSSGYDVTIFDKAESPWMNPNQNLIIGDILSFDDLSKAIEGSDYVYNFAGIADINESLQSPLKTANLNIIGNLNILEASRIHKVKRFIYASSVYVHSADGGFYRCSKACSEQYIQEYQKVFNLDYTIIQYGSLYGPRADATNGLRKIIESAINDEEITYQGDPEAIRSYIHVLDAADSSIKILDDVFKNETLILSGQQSMKVEDLLQMVAEILETSKPIKFLTKEGNGHYARTPYSYKKNLVKNFVPNLHIDLGQGLVEVIEDLNNNTKDS